MALVIRRVNAIPRQVYTKNIVDVSVIIIVNIWLPIILIKVKSERSRKIRMVIVDAAVDDSDKNLRVTSGNIPSGRRLYFFNGPLLNRWIRKWRGSRECRVVRIGVCEGDACIRLAIKSLSNVRSAKSC